MKVSVYLQGKGQTCFLRRIIKLICPLGAKLGRFARSPFHDWDFLHPVFLSCDTDPGVHSVHLGPPPHDPQALGDKWNRCRREAHAACWVWIISWVHMGSHFPHQLNLQKGGELDCQLQRSLMLRACWTSDKSYKERSPMPVQKRLQERTEHMT